MLDFGDCTRFMLTRLLPNNIKLDHDWYVYRESKINVHVHTLEDCTTFFFFKYVQNLSIATPMIVGHCLATMQSICRKLSSYMK